MTTKGKRTIIENVNQKLVAPNQVLQGVLLPHPQQIHRQEGWTEEVVSLTMELNDIVTLIAYFLSIMVLKAAYNGFPGNL